MQKEGFRKKAFVAMKKAFIFLVLPEPVAKHFPMRRELKETKLPRNAGSDRRR